MRIKNFMVEIDLYFRLLTVKSAKAIFPNGSIALCIVELYVAILFL